MQFEGSCRGRCSWVGETRRPSEVPLFTLFLSALAEDELEPARKKRREQLAYLESEDFQTILKAKSRHTGILKEVKKSPEGQGWQRCPQTRALCRGLRISSCFLSRGVSCMSVCLSLFWRTGILLIDFSFAFVALKNIIQHYLNWLQYYKMFQSIFYNFD